jgi:succinyl-diaminopimelate desuccinylase
MNPLADLLFRLIEIPSPNPPGDNRAISQFVADWLTETGAQVQQLAPPQKPEAVSVVAQIGQGLPVIMLHAHADTVPVAESEAQLWTSPPFTPELRDGRIYGKGSVDDKGPLAAMMMAFGQLARSSPMQGTLLLVAAAEEEVGGQLGTHWLVEAGLLPMLDFAVVGEQTENRVATAHKGVMRATITVTGASAHAANPNLGINAINAMARVVLALEEYHQQLASRLHPLVGFPTCNVGVIEGGSTANAVPDFCQIRLDRRMIPGENPDDVKRELEAVVRSVDLGQARLEIGQYLYSSWFESQSGLNSPLGNSFLDWVSRVTHTPADPVGYLPGSDAKHLMPLIRGDMVVFGPGHFSVTHAANEYVELASLETCQQVLVGFLEQALLPTTASSRS